MPNTIRGAHQVDSAFKKVAKRFEAVQKKINSSAAKRMKIGQFEAAKKWMEVGQDFGVFSTKIGVIQQEWSDLVVSSKKTLEGVEFRERDDHKKLCPQKTGWQTLVFQLESSMHQH